MTAERFTYYLNNPSHLYQISYQELKSLVVQYPYCQNLRFMLLAKSQIENSDEYQKDLELAATYSVDRSLLYTLIKNEIVEVGSKDNFVLNDDYLELKDISESTTEGLDILESNNDQEQESLSFEKENEEILKEAEALLTHDEHLDIEEDLELVQMIENEEDEQIPNSTENEVIEVDTPIEKTESDADLELNDSEIALEEIEEIKGEKLAEDISEESEMITYMKKPKKSKSVIDQLLMKYSKEAVDHPEEIKSPILENEPNPEDELESPAQDDSFTDLTPVKDTTTIDREVLFEITNKTDQEIDALMHKSTEEDNEETELSNENVVTMEHLSDESEEPEAINSNDSQPSTPVPKSSFKSYMEQFQPPGIMEEFEEEEELTNAIDEAVKEELLESAIPVPVKKKEKSKGKKDKKKKKKDKSKTEGKVKKKKKNKKKTEIPEAAKQSIQESEDIVSETLAALLAQQGSRKKAIQMYKRLSLIFPEKSSFFAKKIEKLKK